MRVQQHCSSSCPSSSSACALSPPGCSSSPPLGSGSMQLLTLALAEAALPGRAERYFSRKRLNARPLLCAACQACSKKSTLAVLLHHQLHSHMAMPPCVQKASLWVEPRFAFTYRLSPAHTVSPRCGALPACAAAAPHQTACTACASPNCVRRVRLTKLRAPRAPHQTACAACASPNCVRRVRLTKLRAPRAPHQTACAAEPHQTPCQCCRSA